MCNNCGCEHSEKSPRFSHDHRFARERVERIEQDILADNARTAHVNRHRLDASHTLTINLVSSPGAGKTTLLESTIRVLAPRCPLAVIEGDQQTSRDAERIQACGIPSWQVNTGSGCHLSANAVADAMERLEPFPTGGVLFIENVGNLICPSEFDLGEHDRVVLLSCTEGEDKPLKYPNIFASASLLVLTKIDLLPYLDYDLEACLRYVASINPTLEVLQLSSRTTEGFPSWIQWLESRRLTVAERP